MWIERETPSVKTLFCAKILGRFVILSKIGFKEDTPQYAQDTEGCLLCVQRIANPLYITLLIPGDADEKNPHCLQLRQFSSPKNV